MNGRLVVIWSLGFTAFTGCILVDESSNGTDDGGCLDDEWDVGADADVDADADADNPFAEPDPECAADGDCDEGLVCAGERCLAPNDLCTWNWECGPGDECIDGLCRPRCQDDDSCPAGLACVEGICEDAPAECEVDTDCADGPCRAGACSAPCTDDSGCGDDELCDAGACVWDFGCEPFCDADDDCASGHVCAEGVCRSPCSVSDDCARFDVVYTICGEAGLCLAQNEVSPECGRSVDCDDGARCRDALCR